MSLPVFLKQQFPPRPRCAFAVLLLPLLLLSEVSCVTDRTPAPPVITSRGILLRRNLIPGSQAVYVFNSRMTEKTITDRQELDFALNMSAEACETVVEYDSDAGVALVGLIGESKWRIRRGKEGTPEEEPVQQVWCSAYRVDHSGLSMHEQPDRVPADLVRLHREIGQLSQSSQVCAPFPAKRLRVGEEWEGLVLLPLAGMRLPRKATSRITKLYEEDGKRLCAVVSEISLGGRDFYIGWKPGVCLPDMDVRGKSEGVFDLDAGMWREMKWDLAITFDGRGFSGRRWVASNIRLLRARQRTGLVLDELKELTLTFEKALDLLYACRLKEAIEVLERDPGDPGWAKAFELTANLARSFLDPDAAGKGQSVAGLPMPKGDAESLLAVYKQAGALSKAGEKEKAVAIYAKFLELSAAEPLIPARVRILARYRSAGLLEELGRTGDALAGYAAVLTMEGEDDYSRGIKARAREKIAAGNEEEK